MGETGGRVSSRADAGVDRSCIGKSLGEEEGTTGG